MKLYRGTTKKQCESYKKNGIPKGTNFTNRLVGAKNKGGCIIEVNKSKNFEPDKKSNETFKQLNISERYYKNKKPIKNFSLNPKTIIRRIK